MEQEIIKEISSLKVEIKYVNKTLLKVEKVLENQAVLLEKQSVANNRILDLERNDEKLDIRIRGLEEWKIKAVTIGTLLASIFAFIFNKLF